MIDTAILLAAGEGSRLRPVTPFKPLCMVGARTLLAHAIFGFAEAGLDKVIVVLGYGAEHIDAYITENSWPLAIETVKVEDHRMPNGVSVLAAEPFVGRAEVLLAMCDHLVDPALYRRLAQLGANSGARLGIDARIESDWIDLDDVTCVQADGDKIAAIGKGLTEYNCFDTGVFAISPALFDALRVLEAPSLSEGMRLLASRHLAYVSDCSDLDWIDVDDERALHIAERWHQSQRIPNDSATHP